MDDFIIDGQETYQTEGVYVSDIQSFVDASSNDSSQTEINQETLNDEFASWIITDGDGNQVTVGNLEYAQSQGIDLLALEAAPQLMTQSNENDSESSSVILDDIYNQLVMCNSSLSDLQMQIQSGNESQIIYLGLLLGMVCGLFGAFVAYGIFSKLHG